MNIVEAGPSAAASILTATTRLTMRNALNMALAAPTLAHWPWPYGALDRLAGLFPKSRFGRSQCVHLAHSEAHLIHAPNVPDYTGRVILYLHGGGFLVCGHNTHYGLITALSKTANAPVLAVNYRMLPSSLNDGIKDCLDGYVWLRERYDADQIVLAGDSAGGYMAMSVALHLAGIETPAAMVLMSPLLQLEAKGKKHHANAQSDAMFTGAAFDHLVNLLSRANHGDLYEPLDHICTVGWDFPPTLIHVSGSEVLLHDATLAEEMLLDHGLPVEVKVWPGQIHVFQIAAAFVPEARRSLREMGRFIKEKTSNNQAEHRTTVVG